VQRGETYEQLDEHHWVIDPAQPKHYQQFLTAIAKTHSGPIRGVLHLWSLDIPQATDLTAEALGQAQLNGFSSALYLVQALAQPSLAVAARLWLVTRGAMPVGQTGPAIAQSPLWGLGRVIAMEYPQFWGGLCDLPPTATTEEALALLVELNDSQGEDHIVLRPEPSRNGSSSDSRLGRYGARLTPRSFQPALPPAIRADSTHLIAGGLGSLGLKVAQRLVDLGAKHLVLVGRRAPSDQAQAQITAIEQQGITVMVAQADITREDDLASILKEVQRTLPPLVGIIQAAGVSSTVALADLDEATAAAVLQPKLAGTWNLHTLTLGLKLDYFVMFSSISSVWGSKGLGHYAAANHFLDSLAHYRQRLGLPAIAINWGPWAEGGMVAEESQDWLSRRGLEAVSPERGLAALEWLLVKPAVQTIVAGVDWPLFRKLYEASGPRPLLEQLGHKTEQPGQFLRQKERDSVWQALENLPPEERQPRLIAHLQGEIGRVLGIYDPTKLPRPQQGFFDMGMDSLMAVELKNRLENSLAYELPATLLIEAPTLNALGQYLAEQVLHWSDQAAVAPGSAQTEEAALVAETAQLSEVDVEALLAQELGELESLLMED
jgi:NAD(P)-dependent dehydrogenase (short-subunit alcohol dehydrogenase family)/acyl carrier protein